MRQPNKSFKIGKGTYILDSSGVATEKEAMKRQADKAYKIIEKMFKEEEDKERD